jgi:hypothetical protein
MRLANASPGDQQAQEWLARLGETPNSGFDHIRGQLRLALTHLSNAHKDCDLAGILDAVELARARDCIAIALRHCVQPVRDSVG